MIDEQSVTEMSTNHDSTQVQACAKRRQQKMDKKLEEKHCQDQPQSMCLEDKPETSINENINSEFNVSYTTGKGPLLMKLSFWSSQKQVKHIAKVSKVQS